MTDCEKRLRQEREELNRLVDEALLNGTPIDRTYTSMDQSHRVDKLLEQIERERQESFTENRRGRHP